MNETTGQKIYRLRKERGMTQAELALLLGLSANTVKDMESGHNQITRMANVKNLMDIFQISFDYLFADQILAFAKANEEDELKKMLSSELADMKTSDLKLLFEIFESYAELKKPD